MPALSEESPNSALLLCTIYGEKVLCIHHEGPTALEHRGRRVTISRPRGLSLPLFTGAASLAILANLPVHRIKSLYLRHQLSITESGLASSWDEFRGRLSEVRRDNHAYTTNNINRSLAGVAVPIFNPVDGSVRGSLTEVRSRDAFDDREIQAAVTKLSAATSKISARTFSG
jgi:DNA-binding IclR family transcriptional regulator